MSKINLIKTKCTRCNKDLMTTNLSLLGLDKQKAALGIICKGCIKSDEEMKMLLIMGTSIKEAYLC